MEDKILIIIIFPYSPKNKKVNSSPLYSVLNPETNSLSPSEKSKGARLVSHKIEIIQKNPIKGRINKINLFFLNIFEIFKVSLKQHGKRIIVIIFTS